MAAQNPVVQVPMSYPRRGRNGRDGADGMDGANATLQQLLSYIMSDEMLTKKLAAEKELANIQGNFGLQQQGLANEGLRTAEQIRAQGAKDTAQIAADAQRHQTDRMADTAAAALAFERAKFNTEVMKSMIDSDMAYTMNGVYGTGKGGVGTAGGNQWPVYTNPATGKPTYSDPVGAAIREVSRARVTAMLNFLDQTIVGSENLDNEENVKTIAKKVSDFNATAEAAGKMADDKRDQFEGNAAYLLSNLPGIDTAGAIRSAASVFRDGDSGDDMRAWRRMGESLSGILGEDERTIWDMIGQYNSGGTRDMSNSEKAKFEEAVTKLGAGPASVGEIYETFDMAMQSAISKGDTKAAEKLRPFMDALSKVPHATHYKQARAVRDLGKTLSTPTGSRPFNAALMRATLTQAISSPAGERALVEAGAPPGDAARIVRTMKSITPAQSLSLSAAKAVEGENQLNDLQQVLMQHEVEALEENLEATERRAVMDDIHHYSNQYQLAVQAFGAENPATKFYKTQVDTLGQQYYGRFGEMPGGHLDNPDTILQRHQLAASKALQGSLKEHRGRQDYALVREAERLARQQPQGPQPVTPVVETTTKYAPPPTPKPAEGPPAQGGMLPSIQAGFQPQQQGQPQGRQAGEGPVQDLIKGGMGGQ